VFACSWRILRVNAVFHGKASTAITVFNQEKYLDEPLKAIQYQLWVYGAMLREIKAPYL